MTVLQSPLRLLAFLGRYGSQAFAISLVVGFALPQLAQYVRPAFSIIIFLFIALNMVRADLPALRRLMNQPVVLMLATVWSMFLPAAVIGIGILFCGRAVFEPGLLLGLAIAAAAPSLVAAPAYALLLGFSNALPLTVLVFGMSLSPLVAPFLADAVAGTAVPIDRIALMMRLAIFLAGAIGVGLVVRRFAGEQFLKANKAELDGVGVVLFFVFAIALAESVGTAFRQETMKALYYGALTFGLSAICFGLTLLVWWKRSAEDALTLGLATSLRNTGLIIAVMGANSVPDDTFLFFSLLQFPIYFAPQLIKPLARLIHRRNEIGAA